jgi:hypothetical protein
MPGSPSRRRPGGPLWLARLLQVHLPHPEQLLFGPVPVLLRRATRTAPLFPVGIRQGGDRLVVDPELGQGQRDVLHGGRNRRFRHGRSLRLARGPHRCRLPLRGISSYRWLTRGGRRLRLRFPGTRRVGRMASPRRRFAGGGSRSGIFHFAGTFGHKNILPQGCFRYGGRS